MPKFAAWQMDQESYPFAVTIASRFGDMDILGHINNVAMAQLFENGRVQFNYSIDMMNRGTEERWLLAAVKIDYIEEAHFPGDITVASGISRIGTSSWDIASAAFQHDQCVALSTSTLVYTKDGAAFPISAKMRDMFMTHHVKSD